MKYIDCWVDSMVNIPISQLTRKQLLQLKIELTRHNPEYFKLVKLGFQAWGIPREYRLWAQDDENKFLRIQRGMVEAANEVLTMDKIEGNPAQLQITQQSPEIPLDKDINFASSNPLFKGEFKFWPEQLEAIENALAQQSGLLLGGCASGKTEILFGIFQRLKQRTLVIVDNLTLLEQWIKRAKAHFPTIHVGVIQGNKFEIGDITIGSQRTILNRFNQIQDKFSVVLCDEVHHYAARTFLDLISRLPAKYRIGATATIKRKDKKEFLVRAAFGDVFFRITDKELIEKDKTLDVTVVVVPTNFACENYVKEIRDKDTHEVIRTVYDYDYYIRQLVKDTERNNLIYKVVIDQINLGKKCMLISDRVIYCLYWWDRLNDSEIRTGLMIGDNHYKEEREAAPKSMKKGLIKCIVANKIAQEGFDLPELERLFIITPSGSNESKLIQQVGRIRRKADNKEDAVCFYFWDKQIKGFNRHLDTIKKIYKKVEFYAE